MHSLGVGREEKRERRQRNERSNDLRSVRDLVGEGEEKGDSDLLSPVQVIYTLATQE